MTEPVRPLEALKIAEAIVRGHEHFCAKLRDAIVAALLQAAAPPAPTAEPTAKEQHLMDVYDSLGVQWGDDVFFVIAQLKGLAAPREHVLATSRPSRRGAARGAEMSELPKRDAKALIRDLRARAAMLTGQSWERSANHDMMNEAAQMLEDLLQAAAPPAPTAEPRLRAALQRIADEYGDCRCEHDDENCCAFVADYCCPSCLATVALRETLPAAPPERVSEGKEQTLHDIAEGLRQKAEAEDAR
jgi:hypothetical protein